MRDPLTRRRLLQHGAMGSLAIYLAACGTDRPEREVQKVERGEIGDSLYFSNWPLYIEEDRGTLDEFEREFGARVKYVEEINDNQEFFGKVRQQYGQGRSGGRDLHVVTDWMAARMIRLNYVQQLDKSQLPNVQRNLIDRLRDPLFDPKREFSVPWQSGMTGIVYRKDLVKREPESVADLFDPDYKGKVTLLTELYDTVPMTLLSMDVDPTTAKVDDILAAIEKVGEASDSGQFRGFTGNEYTKDLTKGDSALVLGWSGDAVQLKADNPNIEFVQPEEGFLLWADNMQIPVGAPNAFTAQRMMDFVYQPEVQVDITEWVNYVCPVKGVQELIEKRDPELAQSELIFPSEESLQNSTDLRPLLPEEEREVEDAFQRVLGA